MSWNTPDLSDDDSSKQFIAQQWQSFGLRRRFSGEVATVSCFEDNSKVKALANKAGNGRVMIVDGQGSMRRSLLGDMIAQRALDNGWSGFIILGCVRDVDVLDELDIGIKALGVCPVKTEKRDLGEIEVVIKVGDIEIEPGDYVYADRNGVLLAKHAIT